MRRGRTKAISGTATTAAYVTAKSPPTSVLDRTVLALTPDERKHVRVGEHGDLLEEGASERAPNSV
jgi:hypothetical protein